MRKKVYLLALFLGLFVFAQEISKENFLMFQNEYGDVFFYNSNVAHKGFELEDLIRIKDKCGCHQGPSQTTTLLGSCCWTTPSATAPTCHSAAGTGRSCI